MYEIEIPEGANCVYVAELNGQPKFAQEMEVLLAKDPKFEIISFSEKRKYAKLRLIVE